MSTVKKQLKYADLIFQSDDQIKLEEKELTIQKSKSQLEVDIAQTKVDLSSAKQALAASQRAIPYSIHAEITATKKVESIEAGLEFATKILKERF
jgi:GTP-dependent phosphoenolpyruvate carboxykinase